MTNRVSSIHDINNRYRNSRVSPSPIILDSSPIGYPIPTSALGPATTIRRSRIRNSGVGLPIQISGGSRIIGAPLRTSQVRITPPPVYEVITTPPRVYEIVTPIIEVTPDTVVQHHNNMGRNEASAGRAWVKSNQRGGCPWWCWLLLALLLLGLIAGGLLYFFREKVFGKAEGKEVAVGVVAVGEDKENVKIEKEQGNKNVKNDANEKNLPTPTEPSKQTEPKEQPKQTPKPAEDPKPQEAKPTKPEQETGALAVKSDQNNLQKKPEQKHVQQKPKTAVCEQGSFFYKGKCIRCPPQSTWNGSQCIKQVITKRNIIEEKTEGEEDSGDKTSAEEKSAVSAEGGAKESKKEAIEVSQSEAKNETKS